MSRRRWLPTILLSALALLLHTALAGASATQQAAVQDNRLLLVADPAQLDSTLTVLRLLGVKQVQVAVAWNSLAPTPDASQPPAGFDGTNPAAYPAAGWAVYDRLVTEAQRFGIGVTFELRGGAPLWAAGHAPSPRLASIWYPSAAAFGEFAAAVGRRYSGGYVPPGAGAALPAVSSWSIWEQPNSGPSSLAPQVVKGVEVSPAIYRGLANAAFRSLRHTGHRHDTILIGGLDASGSPNPGASGSMEPLRFVRALYCVDAGGHQLLGRAATQRACPPTPSASRAFRAGNPALFSAGGWAERPFYGSTAPDQPLAAAHPDWVAFADLPQLERELDSLQRLYGSRSRLGIYVSAYGFNTNPPQHGNAVSPGTQASYLNEAEYLAWRDPRIRTLTQYLLTDTGAAGSATTLAASGLLFDTGKPKQAFDAYRLPLWVPQRAVPRGTAQELWGCLRPSHFTVAEGGSQIVHIEFQPGSSGQFLWLGSVTVRSTRSCYFDLHVQFPESGTVRLSYRYPANDPVVPAGTTVYSRTVRITLLY